MSNETETVIEIKGLQKLYGKRVALDSVDLSILKGSTGLLAPNGAGKSTLIKCLLQLEAKQAGSASLLGKDIDRHGRETRKRIGYAPEQECHIPGMIGCEYVTYCGELSGMPFQAARQRAHEMLDFVGMGQERYRKVDTYSTGMKQRIKIAQTLVHDPDLIVLDEPMNGLDPNGRNDFSEIIKELSEDGKSILISSHILQELETLCNRFLILNWGRLLASGSPTDIRQQSRQWSDEVTIRCSEPQKLATFLLTEGIITGFRAEGDSLTLWLTDPKSFYKKWTDVISESQVTIYDFRNRNQALTNLFEQMIQ